MGRILGSLEGWSTDKGEKVKTESSTSRKAAMDWRGVLTYLPGEQNGPAEMECFKLMPGRRGQGRVCDDPSYA